MDIAELDINAVCFGILCNFPQFCGEERAKEAAELVHALYAERETLRAELEQIKTDRDRYKSHVERLLSLPDCNTCDSKDRCAYCPDIGAFTRINCPLWRGQKED